MVCIKKIIGSFLFIFFCISSYSQQQDKLTVNRNINVETYFIAERLAVEKIGYYVFDNKGADYAHQPIVSFAFKQFQPYKDSPLLDSIAVLLPLIRDRFFDNLPIIEYLLYQKPYPQKGALYKRTVADPVTEAQFQKLSGYLLQFFRQANLEEFFKNTSGFYKGAVAEVKKIIPPSIYPAMEKYFGTSFSQYDMILSPAMPITAGADNYRGVGIKLKTGKGDIACMVISTNTMLPPLTQINEYKSYGFNNKSIIEFLTVHEINHSFVNPVLDRFTGVIERDTALFTEQLRKVMTPQGYTSWSVCLTEHIVRLCEIRIAEQMKKTDWANQLRQMHRDSSYFVLLPLMESVIDTFESDRKKYPLFSDFVPVLLTKIHALKPKDIDSLLQR